jgi:hypothetical protein
MTPRGDFHARAEVTGLNVSRRHRPKYPLVCAAKAVLSYVIKKAAAYITVVVLVLTSFLGFGLAFQTLHDAAHTLGRAVDVDWTPLAICQSFGVSLGCGLLLGIVAYKLCKPAYASAEAVRYVPPAADQFAAHPPEQILVRGSDEPTAKPEELLRAAQPGTEAQGRELLRADENTAGRRTQV